MYFLFYFMSTDPCKETITRPWLMFPYAGHLAPVSLSAPDVSDPLDIVLFLVMSELCVYVCVFACVCTVISCKCVLSPQCSVMVCMINTWAGMWSC